MRPIPQVLATGLLLLGVADSAQAVVITIDADDFAVGTNLTEVVSDVSISHLFQRGGLSCGAGCVIYDPVRSDVLVADVGAWYSSGNSMGAGQYFFEYEACYGRNSAWGCGTGFSVIEFAFSSPTDFVHIDFRWGMDAPGILIYGDDGSLLASCYSGSGGLAYGPCDYSGGYQPDGSDYSFSLQLDSPRIGRIIAGTPAGAQASVESISFSVPEPGTLALLSLGLAGLGFTKRRKIA